VADLTPLLAVVMPVYNEAGLVEAVVRGLERDVLGRFGPDCRLIVVDDASTDGTSEILRRLAERNPQIQVEHLENNGGHGPAVCRGLDLAQADWVFQLDSDGQFDTSDFAKLWERRDEADLVVGVRRPRRDPVHRLMLGTVVRAAVGVLAGRRLRDPNAPFRLLRRQLWEDARPLLPPVPLAPSIFVTLVAARRGYRIAEIPVRHLARAQGGSSLRALRLVRFSAGGLRQLIALRVALTRRDPHPRTGSV
jgi:glycosyltransferase involved in cell wall biosynthesis